LNLSIKNVPDDIVEALKKRATSNHRSLQGELRAIVEDAALREAPRRRPALTIREALEHMRALGVSTKDDSTEIIRQARDERYGR
jgi:plasmid stability protein